jgi:hypothetical protein
MKTLRGAVLHPPLQGSVPGPIEKPQRLACGSCDADTSVWSHSAGFLIGHTGFRFGRLLPLQLGVVTEASPNTVDLGLLSVRE